MQRLVFLLPLVLFACSASSISRFDDPSKGDASSDDGNGNGDGDGSGNGNGNGDGNGDFGTGGNDAGANTGDGCSDAAKLVYVVSDQGELYSFAPDKLKFTSIGTLDCPGSFATANSMAVDRQGTAWVNYSDGSLFKVSTKDASCTSTPFQPGQHGFGRFGMAFVSNAAGSQDETLFISGIGTGNKGLGLATVDLKTFKTTMVGDYDGSLKGVNAELTGTGNGTLFGFFTTNPATFAQIDKSTAKTSDHVTLDGLNNVSAWAFSFWGGDFWFYSSSGLQPSKVTRLKASGDGSQSVVVQDVGGFRIVGAGVSTCAPVKPPN